MFIDHAMAMSSGFANIDGKDVMIYIFLTVAVYFVGFVGLAFFFRWLSKKLKEMITK
jgi:hypothetical protein